MPCSRDIGQMIYQSMFAKLRVTLPNFFWRDDQCDLAMICFINDTLDLAGNELDPLWDWSLIGEIWKFYARNPRNYFVSNKRAMLRLKEKWKKPNFRWNWAIKRKSHVSLSAATMKWGDEFAKKKWLTACPHHLLEGGNKQLLLFGKKPPLLKLCQVMIVFQISRLQYFFGFAEMTSI